MDNLITEINALTQFIPELEPIILQRYNILYTINYSQPIGRRNLCHKMHLTERIIRRECTVLKDAGYLDFTADGMRTTSKGKKTLHLFSDYIHFKEGVCALERRVAKKLGVARVILVPDDEEEDVMLREIGDRCATILKEMLPTSKILGITGGSSVYEVTEAFRQEGQDYEHLTIVPARGGVGRETRHQANSLAENLAHYLGCKYSNLFIPDSLSVSSIEQLKTEPSVKKSFEQIQKIDTLIFGVGLAQTLAGRRGLSHERIEEITSKGAVAEAFGYYFNREGQIVDEITTLGISLEKVKTLTRVIAVAGGKDKAEAIIAVSKLNPNIIVITNEGIATQIESLS